MGTPKIIAIIRDPFNRAFSAYKHLVRDEREFLPFHEALQKEEERIRNNWELIYHYTQASQYYDCIKAFKEKFPEVLVLLNEDLKNDPQGTFKRIFNFLEVDSTYQVTDVKQLNKSGKPKSQVLHYGLNGKGMISKIGKPLLRLLVPQADKRAAVRVAIKNWNLKDIKSSNEEEERLRQYFAEDVLKTGDLIQRDLGHWISK
ncbi:MAG: sulfotransferase [Owenweeksia sp.]|nr:sulfotransferase [Owenweeksia sp.]